MKAKKNLKVRLVFLYIGSFIISIAPLVIVLALNWGDYTKTPGDTIKLCFGGVFALFLIFLKVIGKLKMPRRIVFFAVIFVLAYLLQALLEDIILLTGMALAGELIDLLCFQKPKVERSHRSDQESFYNYLTYSTYDELKDKMQEWLDRYNNRPHSSLRNREGKRVWLTPLQKRAELFEDYRQNGFKDETDTEFRIRFIKKAA